MLNVYCDQCMAELIHVCNVDLKESFINLFRLQTNVSPKTRKHKKEPITVISEAFLYDLLGKEDARTLLACIRNIARAVGLDPDSLEDTAYKKNAKEI